LHGPKEPLLDVGSYGHHLASMVEQLVLGSDAGYYYHYYCSLLVFNLGDTAKQAAMVWAYVVKRRQ